MRIAVVFLFGVLFSAGPALAFDCSKASTRVEKAICASPAALRANDAMESAYFRLRDQLKGGPGETTLREGQRAWLARRDRICGTEADCLESESTGRAEILNRTPAGMVPFFRYQAPKPKHYSVVLEGYRFAGEMPGSRAFHLLLDDVLADAPLGPQDEVEPDLEYEYEVMVSVDRLSARLISAVAATYAYSGGAHPNGWTRALHVDRQTGRELTIADLFDEAALATLAQECRVQIVREKDEYQGMNEETALSSLEEQYSGTVAASAADPARWWFPAGNAVLAFDSYDIGPYAAGPFECTFDYARLRGLARDPSIFD